MFFFFATLLVMNDELRVINYFLLALNNLKNTNINQLLVCKSVAHSAVKTKKVFF